ncbi:MAG: hypothetical protein AAF481_04810 [Acidobacteriota bacterium]
MNDEHLDQALSSLPREQASDRFTATVLRRAEERTGGTALRPPGWRASRPHALRWSWAAACLAILVVGGTLWRTAGSLNSEGPETGSATLATSTSLEEDAARALLAELKAEHRQLTHDLRQRREEPVLYLGGDEGLDLVLDLGRTDLMPTRGSYRPASQTNPRPNRVY